MSSQQTAVRSDGPGARSTARGTWSRDAAVLAIGALAIRLPALLAPTNLGYDDGGYGLAVVAMRQGYLPFRDIFSSQGPLFLLLARLADLAGFEAMIAPRLLAVAAGAVVTVAVYAAGRELMDRGRALLAGALCATSGVLLWTTGPLTGDGAAAAFATSAVAVALAYRRAPSTGKAVAITLLAGGALAVKSLLVGPALAVAWLLVVAGRRWRHALLVPLGAVAVVLVASIPWGLGNVYDDYVAYHIDKTTQRTPLANLSKIVTTYLRRSPALVAVALLGFGAAALGYRTGERRPRPGGRGLARLLGGSRVLWWWAGLALVVLVLQEPLFRNHLTTLVAPLALLAARYRPSWRVVAVAVVVTAPIQVVALRPLLAPQGFTGSDAAIVRSLRELPAGAWVLSDEPGLVWRAGKATDPFYVDPSVLRIRSKVDPIRITEDRVARAARNPRVCAVVVGSRVRFGSFVDLGGRLEGLGYVRVSPSGGAEAREPDGAAPLPALYLRSGCAPER